MGLGTMAMEVVCTCTRDPFKGAHSVKGCALHDPTLTGPISRPDGELFSRARNCLNRWASRYADSEHARKHVKETRLLIQEIDELILRQ